MPWPDHHPVIAVWRRICRAVLRVARCLWLRWCIGPRFLIGFEAGQQRGLWLHLGPLAVHISWECADEA
jgi:hypothetical protein